jgi:hypothetical protein
MCLKMTKMVGYLPGTAFPVSACTGLKEKGTVDLKKKPLKEQFT